MRMPEEIIDVAKKEQEKLPLWPTLVGFATVPFFLAVTMLQPPDTKQEVPQREPAASAPVAKAPIRFGR